MGASTHMAGTYGRQYTHGWYMWAPVQTWLVHVGGGTARVATSPKGVQGGLLAAGRVALHAYAHGRVALHAYAHGNRLE